MKVVYLVRNPGIVSRTPPGWSSAVLSADPDGRWPDQVLRQLEDADFLVVGLEPDDEEIFGRTRRLKLVQRLGRGHENVDLEAAARRGIPVCTMPDFNAAAVAEHAFMLMLALAKRLFESTLLMKAGRWPAREVVGRLTPHLAGQTREAMERMVSVMLENLERVAAGNEPLYRVEGSE